MFTSFPHNHFALLSEGLGRFYDFGYDFVFGSGVVGNVTLVLA